MTANVVNQVAYLRTSRNFPEDLGQLTVEVNKAYVETANVVNNRIISIFTVNRPAINGESWFITKNQKQQGLRQVYNFNNTTSINHGVMVTNPRQFIRCFGSYTDGIDTFGLIYASSVPIAGQIGFYVTSTQIVFTLGGGAPALVEGTIVLEWISEP